MTARSKSIWPQASVGVDIMAPPGMEDMTNQLQSMFSNLGQGAPEQAGEGEGCA
jgi:ATP-dependent protease HslVU (ClpYQ) ATPase subunit